MKEVKYSIRKSKNGYTVRIYENKKVQLKQEFTHRPHCVNAVNTYCLLNNVTEIKIRAFRNF